MSDGSTIAALFFVLTLVITYGCAIAARFKKRGHDQDELLAGRSLNRWLIGVSAGTTGNSGFIVTAAVALGYTGGIHWILLPLSWLLGDLVFWGIFPGRINKLARDLKAVTLSEMLTKGLEPVWVKLIVIVTSLLLVTCLSMYTAAQWLAGKKFLSGAFGITEHISLLLFGLSIVGYSCLGGFRGSVYADVLQGMIRIFGTFVALAAVILFAVSDPDTFRRNFSGVSANYFSFFDGGLIASIGFILGFAAAAIGFGLGQPQIASRYMAGSSPSETQAARWIYIGFIQYTWISMTVFGVVLRGVMPDIVDPESGLSVFFQKHIGGILTGIIFADVFATIASTSNGILVSIAQIVQRDLLQRAGPLHFSELNQILLTFVLGVCTIFLSIIVPGNVFSMAIDSVSIIGAGIAAPMMIRLFSWKHTGGSLFISIIGGILPGTIWKVFGLDTLINEAAVGILCSLTINFALNSTLFHYRRLPRSG